MPKHLTQMAVCVALLAVARSDGGARVKPRVIVAIDPIEIDENYTLIDNDIDPNHPQTGDPDDIQSFVRFLVYSNEFRIEGLIAASERIEQNGKRVWLNRDYSLLRMLDKYDAVAGNLRRHDPGYPTADALRSKVRQGYSSGRPDGNPGHPGPGKKNAGSDLIIRVVDSSVEPVWYLDWVGQPQQFELAQALWQVRESRSAADFAQFVSKIRAHFVMVDTRPGTPGKWLEDNVPELFLMGSRSGGTLAFRALSDRFLHRADSTLWNLDWLNTHVRRGHGALGAMAPTHTNPKKPGLHDHDSVTFLYLIPNGLGDIESPGMGSWGGRFRLEGGAKRWVPAGDRHPTSSDPAQSIYWAIGRHHRAIQNDFAARMDWCVRSYTGANHNPVVRLNGRGGRDVLRLAAAAGETVKLSAAGSSDPDNDSLSYHWWRYHEADSYPGDVSIENDRGRDAWFVAPAAARGKQIHIVVEVTDNGEPPLTSYRRAIVTVE